MQHTEKVIPAKDYHRAFDLLLQVATREISARYRGAILGVFASPVNSAHDARNLRGRVWLDFQRSLLSQTRRNLGSLRERTLFVGWLSLTIFAECLILANPNYVTKVVFPIEIIPIAINISALFHLCVNGLLDQGR